MNCPYCNKEIKDGSYFCSFCKSIIALEDVIEIFKEENLDEFNLFCEKLKKQEEKDRYT